LGFCSTHPGSRLAMILFQVLAVTSLAGGASHDYSFFDRFLTPHFPQALRFFDAQYRLSKAYKTCSLTLLLSGLCVPLYAISVFSAIWEHVR